MAKLWHAATEPVKSRQCVLLMSQVAHLHDSHGMGTSSCIGQLRSCKLFREVGVQKKQN